MATYNLAFPDVAIDAILTTAYHLQQVGYIFRGSASDYSGTPTEREWVIAPAGFSGLGLSSAVPKGSIGVCLYNGTAWVGKVINVLTLDSEPTRNSQNGVTSGGVAATLDEIAGGIMETFASLLFDDETAAGDLSTKLSYAVKFSVSDVYQTVTHLNILAATTSKAGLMSAEDKAKVDSFLTGIRSMQFVDATSSSEQAIKLVEQLKWTVGGVQEVIDSITLLAATSSKAGLLSASDKAYIDALPATLTSLSNSISGALALMQSLVGYYVCDTAAGTAAKTVAATGYSLTNGGCIRIKMTNANTAANVTLNINSTGAKALYYDGAQASSTNTWEAGEVLEVYYDGTQYQCASGGGGGKFATGEKVNETRITDRIANTNNLPTAAAVSQFVKVLVDEDSEADLDIADEEGHVCMRLKDGHVQTKEFNSRGVVNTFNDESDADLNISDEQGNVIMQLKGGEVKTKNFDSSEIGGGGERARLLHIILLGQSLSMGYISSPVLSAVDSQKTKMFSHVRTQDFGYVFNIAKETYNNDQDYYNSLFYDNIQPLVEQANYGQGGWESVSNREYETPCSGIAEGILNCYKELGYKDLPFYTLCTAPGIGGSPASAFDSDEDKIIARMKFDVVYAMAYAASMKLAYEPVFFWVQGENNYSTSVDDYKTALNTIYTNLLNGMRSVGVNVEKQKIPFISYQTNSHPNNYYNNKSARPAIAQFEMDAEEWFYLAYPIYNLQHKDYVHLTNLSSRALGNSLGIAAFYAKNEDFCTLKIVNAEKDGNDVILRFNKQIEVDYQHLVRDGYTQEQNAEIQANWGFYAFDSSDVQLTVTPTQVNDSVIKLTCSAEPSVIHYGYIDIAGIIVGGCIREKKIRNGYNDTPLYLYMPVQYVNSFTTKYIF